jgi:predicted outer membrane protein
MTTSTRTARRRHRHPLRWVLAALLLVAGLAPMLARPGTILAGEHDELPSSPPSVPSHDMGGASASSSAAVPVVPPVSSDRGGPPEYDAPLSASDRDFLVRVRQAGLWEGPAGQDAQVRSGNQLVREAGQHLIAGHAELDAKVLRLGAELNVPLPSEPSQAQQGWLAEMAATTTPQDFDRVFVNRVRAAHGTVYALVAQIRAGTRNSVIRRFAQRTMEVVLDHMSVLERTGLVDYGALPQPKLLPGAAQIATVPTAYGPMTAADYDFQVRVRLAGLWEGPSGQLAQQRAGSPLVKDAGQHLIAGHAELDAGVLALASQLGVQLPAEPSKDQKTWLGEMVSAADPQAFDQVFVDRLRAAHGTVYAFVAAVRADTGNSAIRTFAQRVTEVVLDHITALERTGLVRYDSLPQPPQPPPSASAGPVVGRRGGVSGIFVYAIGGMLVLGLATTIIAGRDLLPRSN